MIVFVPCLSVNHNDKYKSPVFAGITGGKEKLTPFSGFQAFDICSEQTSLTVKQSCFLVSVPVLKDLSVNFRVVTGSNIVF